jgi:ribosomal protein L37E
MLPLNDANKSAGLHSTILNDTAMKRKYRYPSCVRSRHLILTICGALMFACPVFISLAGLWIQQFHKVQTSGRMKSVPISQSTMLAIATTELLILLFAGCVLASMFPVLVRAAQHDGQLCVRCGYVTGTQSLCAECGDVANPIKRATQWQQVLTSTSYARLANKLGRRRRKVCTSANARSSE